MIHFYISTSIRCLVIAALVLVVTTGDSTACTTFSFMDQGRSFVAKNYDWGHEDGIVYVNKRGVAKQSLAVLPTDKPVNWISKFGSVTFNQYGRELPNAGMNEAGLVVEVMELSSSQFQKDPSMPSLNESQWVQFMLDNAANVGDVKRLSTSVRVSKILVPLHYMVCDKSGTCVAVELLSGRVKISDQNAPAIQVLTNSTYGESLSYLSRFEGFGGTEVPPSGDGSLERFARAADFVRKMKQTGDANLVLEGFKGLKSVQTSITQWSIIYDMSAGQIAFKSKSNPSLKFLKIGGFDFDCRSAVVGLSIMSNLTGDVTSNFVDYDDQINRDLVRRSLSGNVPENLIDAAANLPSTTFCRRELAH